MRPAKTNHPTPAKSSPAGAPPPATHASATHVPPRTVLIREPVSEQNLRSTHISARIFPRLSALPSAAVTGRRRRVAQSHTARG